MHKNERNSKSQSFDLSNENKENEVLAALNKTEIELNKINKYLYDDYQALTNISTRNQKNSSKCFEKILMEQHQNVNIKNKQTIKNDQNEHTSNPPLFCSPRFNSNHEIFNNFQKGNYFKVIKPENKEETKEMKNDHNNNNTKNKKAIPQTFTLNDCSKTQSSEASKDISQNTNNEAPIHTFQMRGTPEKSNISQRSSGKLALSNKKNGFAEVSNNNFEEISEIQMIDNMEPDSFKLNEKSTLKGKFEDLNNMNYENGENFPSNLNNLVYLLDVEKEKNTKLEEKLENKDRLLNQMKVFHNELQSTLQETQKELDKQNSLRSMSLNNFSSDNQNKTIKRLNKENQDLKKKIMEKDLKIEAYMKEERQKSEDISNDKSTYKKLNTQMNSLVQINKKLTSEIEVFRQHKNIYEKEKNYLKATLQENQLIINDLNKEKEMLVKRIENFSQLNKEKEKCLQTKIDQTYDELSYEKTYKDLNSYKKMTQQFIKSLTQMMILISPEGYFDEKPSLKKIWKLLKKILEDYMNIKMELNGKNEIIQKLMEIFSTNKVDEILPIMHSFIGEYDLMGKIINIFKKEAGIEENLDDLETLYDIIKKKYDFV